MSITSKQPRNARKYRIVFLGDQGVGKTSIIQRYTTDRFDQGYNEYSRLLELILMLKMLLGMGLIIGCRCGILLGSNDIVVQSQHTQKMHIVLFQYSIQQKPKLYKVLTIGINYLQIINKHQVQLQQIKWIYLTYHQLEKQVKTKLNNFVKIINQNICKYLQKVVKKQVNFLIHSLI